MTIVNYDTPSFQFLSIELQALRLCCLLTQTEGLHDGTVAVDVALLQVSEQTTTLTDELSQ